MSLLAEIDLTLGALHLDVRLDVDDAVIAVVGPNGAGKTTLLSALAGLVPLTAGRVSVDGRVLEDAITSVRLAPEQRRVGVVFQEHRLFPHLSAVENVAFGLRASGTPKGEARRVAREWLDRMGVGDLAACKPPVLSGGQAQRVALARALATKPALLLLDEPLAAVDASARTELRALLRTELRQAAGARVLVTHDPIEAAALADRLVVLEDGVITQEGELADVTARPRSAWVADMVGLNLLRGTAEGTTVALDGGVTMVTARAARGPVFVAFRPNAIGIHRTRPRGSARNVWRVTVTEMYPAGDRARVRLDGEVRVVAEVTAGAVAELKLADGGDGWASLKATEVEVYPA